MKYERLTERAGNGQARLKMCKICPDYCYNCEPTDEAIDRLAELEDDLESGKIIRLPCKVGDTVYYTSPEYYNSLLVEYKVTEISQTREGIRLAVYGSPREKGLITYLWESYIGKTVFLTREEAEKRLKELQE